MSSTEKSNRRPSALAPKGEYVTTRAEVDGVFTFTTEFHLTKDEAGSQEVVVVYVSPGPSPERVRWEVLRNAQPPLSSEAAPMKPVKGTVAEGLWLTLGDALEELKR